MKLLNWRNWKLQIYLFAVRKLEVGGFTWTNRSERCCSLDQCCYCSAHVNVLQSRFSLFRLQQTLTNVDDLNLLILFSDFSSY